MSSTVFSRISRFAFLLTRSHFQHHLALSKVRFPYHNLPDCIYYEYSEQHKTYLPNSSPASLLVLLHHWISETPESKRRGSEFLIKEAIVPGLYSSLGKISGR
jgi:hypothetical protein